MKKTIFDSYADSALDKARIPIDRLAHSSLLQRKYSRTVKLLVFASFPHTCINCSEKCQLGNNNGKNPDLLQDRDRRIISKRDYFCLRRRARSAPPTRSRRPEVGSGTPALDHEVIAGPVPPPQFLERFKTEAFVPAVLMIVSALLAINISVSPDLYCVSTMP